MSVVKIDTDKYPNIASRYGIKVCLFSTDGIHTIVLVSCICTGSFWLGPCWQQMMGSLALLFRIPSVIGCKLLPRASNINVLLGVHTLL